MKGIRDQQELKELVNYNPLTGFFTWRKRPVHSATKRTDKTWNSRFAGKQAGASTSGGYVQIALRSKLYAAHRLAHLFMTGEWPEHEVDHVDGDRADNRWHKLRAATRQEQVLNMGMPTHNTSGVVGVLWNKQNGKWKAQVKVSNKVMNLGSFETKEEAIAAREAANERYGFHPNHGKRDGYRK